MEVNMPNFPVYHLQRFFPFRLNELIDKDSHTVLEFIKSRNYVDIVKDIIMMIRYPFKNGEPDDEHFYSAFNDIYHFNKRIKWDYWQKGEETLSILVGDCLEENEEILMKDYERKKIKDIQIGEEVMSYNIQKKMFEPQKVTKKWGKGLKDVYRIYLRNGAWFDGTLDHKIFTWDKDFWNLKGKEDYEGRLVLK